MGFSVNPGMKPTTVVTERTAMPRQHPIYTWRNQVVTAFDDVLSRPQAVTLALDNFQRLLPVTWTVIVLTDRGLYGRWLFQAIVALGWHPLMRVTHTGKFRAAGAK